MEEVQEPGIDVIRQGQGAKPLKEGAMPCHIKGLGEVQGNDMGIWFTCKDI